MNILSQLTRQTLRQNRTRSLAAFGGIFLAAAMFTILTTAVFSLWDYVRRGTEYETGDYFVSADFVDEAGLETAQNDPLIRRVSDMKITGCYSQFERIAPGSTYPVAAVDNAFFKEMTVPLKEGRLPENSSEILIPEQINLVCLQQGWKTWKIGESVNLDLFDLRKAKTVEENGWSKQYRPDETESQEYRIVGITRNKAYSDDENDWGAYCLLTLADGAEGDTLWHRLFLKTAPKDATAVLARHYGQKSFLNDDLLRVHGAGGIGQNTVIILVITLAALLIASALSAVLIRSIFSVSVTERTREFGLLASIGTTPKQISGLVRREALTFLAASL
ncbi:MAG: ABC transporter permease, partial [Lachnospiraceae bacterium]|nr:ABC transporter permease [Lachnospiraceae bacterium]